MNKPITKDLQIELLKKDVSFKDKQIDKLEERINKAIEYIKNFKDMEKYNSGYYLMDNKKTFDKLLKILKGEENESN